MTDPGAFGNAIDAVRSAKAIATSLATAKGRNLTTARLKLQMHLEEIEKFIISLDQDRAGGADVDESPVAASTRRGPKISARYHRQELEPGMFVYVLKPTARGRESFHWLCANCFECGRKSALHPRATAIHAEGGRRIWSCLNCSEAIRVDHSLSPATTAAQNG